MACVYCVMRDRYVIVCRLGEDAIKKKQEEEEERMQHEKDQETTWYHVGPEALRVSRLWIASERICVCVHVHVHFLNGTTIKQLVVAFMCFQ
jgi:hypothetical protein